MHLIARMLDPTYEPDDPRTLMHTLNESLRSMLGHGAEDWVSEPRKPWRNMVIRRGLAGPSGSAGQPFWFGEGTTLGGEPLEQR